MSNCRSCGKKISFVMMKSGKLNPVDENYISVVTDHGDIIRGRESHFATCPDAGKWRKGSD